MTQGATITEEFGRDLQDLVRKNRSHPDWQPKTNPARGRGMGGKIVFMLLEELRSGKSAWAVRLTGDDLQRKQLITVFGQKNANATFRILWNDETVEPISVYATPLELKTKLEEFTFIDPGDVFVQFGNHLRSIDETETKEFNTFRWIVKFRDGFSITPDPGLMMPVGMAGDIWMGAEETELEDSYDLIRVKSLIPVGIDIEGNSPMVAGAIGIASFIYGSERPLGWAVDAIEARHLLGNTLSEVEY